MSDRNPAIEDRVKARAYALWEADGRPEGRSDQHWHQARSEIEIEIESGAGAVDERGAPGSAPAGKKRKASKTADLHIGMLGDATEEQNLDQEGDPAARITEAEVQEAFKANPKRL